VEQETGIKKTTILLIGLAVLLLGLVIALGVLLLGNLGFGKTYQEQLNAAERYVAEGNYEAAILAYQEAIEKDENNAEAYVALAELFIDRGRMDEARELLERGLLKTNSPRLEYLIKRYFLDKPAEEESDVEEERGGTESGESDSTATTAGEDVDGKVVDATTGNAVSNAKLEFRRGTKSVGVVDVTVTTDRNGNYNLSLEDGEYRVTISKSGYTTETFELHISQGNPDTSQFVVSPRLEVGEIRIVLTWGDTPRDLDSYLTGRLDDGSTVDVSYSRRESRDRNGEKAADLDVDDTNGNGPETTTIYQTAGAFEFKVQDFTRTGTMSSSGAQVKVYVGNQAPVIIDVPEGLRNDWFVCRIDHGVVDVVNTAG
jgi:hypothetical protein